LATQPNPLTMEANVERYSALLLDQGFVVVPSAADPDLIHSLDGDFANCFAQTPFSRGNFSGERTVRFGRVLLRSDHARTLIQSPTVLGIAERVLLPWCDSIQLNLTQGIAVHPGAPAQLPHRDQDMWNGAKGEVEYMVNAIWPLSRFSRENGATLVWKGSHRANIGEYVSDDRAIAVEMEVGDVLIFLGSTLHGQGANESEEIRRALAVGYSLSWLKPYENQMLSYPPHIAREFSQELAELVGYKQLPSNLNNFDGQSPSVLLDEHVPDYFGFVDAFRPDQVEAIDYYFEHRKPRLV